MQTIPASPIGAAVFATTSDPTSNVALPNGEPRMGLTYDWAAHRWLPVPSRYVAPGGAQYAYVDSSSRIHVVTLSDGTDKVIASGAAWGLYAFTVNGVYAGQRDAGQDPSLIGLYVMSPDGTSSTRLETTGTWIGVSDDAAWSVVQEGTAPAGAGAIEDSVGSTLIRLDLSSGAQQTWYTSPNGRVSIGAIDRIGDPVLVNVDAGQVLLVTGDAAARTIYAQGLPLTVMADGYGVWITDPMLSSIYLSQGTDAVRLGQYGYGGTAQFAGPCHP